MDTKNLLKKIELTSLALMSVLASNVKTIPIINKDNPLVVTNEIQAAKKQNYHKYGTKEDGYIEERYNIGKTYYLNGSQYDNNKLTKKMNNKGVSYDQRKLGLNFNAVVLKGTCNIYENYKQIGNKYTYTKKTMMNGMWGTQDGSCSLNVFFNGKAKVETTSSSKKVTKEYKVTFTPVIDDSHEIFIDTLVYPKAKKTLVSTTTISGLKSAQLVKGSKNIVRKYDSNGRVKSKISYKYNGKKWIKTS